VPTRFPQLLGGEPFEVSGYPVETVRAEKIAAALDLGGLNTRDRDWADVPLYGSGTTSGHRVILLKSNRHRSSCPLNSFSQVGRETSDGQGVCGLRWPAGQAGRCDRRRGRVPLGVGRTERQGDDSSGHRHHGGGRRLSCTH
jgi:hypothetical protein